MAEYGGVTASMAVEKPEDVRVSLTLTMRVSEWEVLRASLVSGYPEWGVKAAISDLVRQVTERFVGKIDDEPARAVEGE